MLLIWNHVGYRTQLFAAFFTLALLGGTLQVSADADSIASFESPSGVRIEYGIPLEATVKARRVSQEPETAQGTSQPVQSVRPLQLAPRTGTTIDRAGARHEKNVIIHRSGESDGANTIIHRSGQWSGLAHYKSNLRIHRMGEPRGSNIPIHRMGEPRGSNIRIHRAGTWGRLLFK